MADNRNNARRMAERIKSSATKDASAGMEAAMIFLLAKVKETVSVPAPKVRTASGYRVITPAEVGAPPRRVSGALLSGLGYKLTKLAGSITSKARSPRGFDYPMYHEIIKPGMAGSGHHQFIRPTLLKNRQTIKGIIAGKMTGTAGKSSTKAS